MLIQLPRELCKKPQCIANSICMCLVEGNARVMEMWSASMLVCWLKQVRVIIGYMYSIDSHGADNYLCDYLEWFDTC